VVGATSSLLQSMFSVWRIEQSQLSRMKLLDALCHAQCVVNKGGRSVW